MSKRCMGCMSLYDERYRACPYCGYDETLDAADALYLTPGVILNGRYTVGRVLGSGGFGITYLAWDHVLEQKVAIKEYLPGEFAARVQGSSDVSVFSGDRAEQFQDGLSKFLDEAKRLAKFQNEPGIVRVFDGFMQNKTAYLVMEFLDGETLAACLRRETVIPEDEAVRLIRPVMKSLQVVHAAGILHRDIAPDNIFLTKHGEVKLIDFGASRYATTSYSRSLTVIIKPGYSPEEQYRSRGDQGPYTDVFSLAATLYKMMTGKTPPDALERRSNIERYGRDNLVPPRKLDRSISVNRENALLNAMNIRIEDRTPDVRHFMEELDSDTPVRRIRSTVARRSNPWPLWLKMAVSFLSVFLISAGILFLGGGRLRSVLPKRLTTPRGVVIVPELEGMSREEAMQALESAKLKAQAGGSVESAYLEAGTVVLQDPPGGTYVEKNSTVLLTVSVDAAPKGKQNGMVAVPDLIGESEDDAFNSLYEIGLAVSHIEYSPDASVKSGIVISQSKAPGTSLPEGTQITLIVSSGPAG